MPHLYYLCFLYVPVVYVLREYVEEDPKIVIDRDGWYDVDLGTVYLTI